MNQSTTSVENCHSWCLICGDKNPLSLKLSFQAEDNGCVKADFQSHREFQGYDNIIHGGVIAALLDAAMTHCLFHRGVQAVTGDLHIRFVKSVSCDASIEIKAWVSSFRPPLYRLKAEIVHNEQVMAWADAKFMQR